MAERLGGWLALGLRGEFLLLVLGWCGLLVCGFWLIFFLFWVVLVDAEVWTGRWGGVLRWAGLG